MDYATLQSVLRNVDPTLGFAVQSELFDPLWIDICLQDKTKWDRATAQNYYEIFRKGAEAGSPFAMCICSRFSLAGLGQSRSAEKALEWVAMAVACESALGHFEMAGFYQRGIGLPVHLDQARAHYLSSAKLGFGFAATQLAVMYQTGQFGSIDMASAIEYATLAYQLNDAMAPLMIANWFERGDGVAKNEEEAARWYMQAAEMGNFLASLRLSEAYANAELGLPKDETLAKKFETDNERQTQNIIDCLSVR